MERIGWIGLGLMGSRMLPHLLEAGYAVTIYARRDAAAEPFVAGGARRVADAAEVAAASDIVFTIVAMPADVEEVYLGPRGLLGEAAPGSLLVDMTTSSPALARRIAATARAADIETIDAPVSGGPGGAENAALSIMLGGSDAAVERVMPVLRHLGTSIVHHGTHGSGQAAKIANQIVVGGSMLAISEAFLSAGAAGLDPERMLETLAAGIAGSGLLRFMWPRIAAGDLEPGFRVEHLIKDLGLALDAARDSEVALPGTAMVKELYHAVIAAGYADKGSQALITVLERGAAAEAER